MPAPYIVLFDGDCLLCLRSVQFVAARDPHGRFRFARLESETGRRLRAPFGPALARVDSVVLLADGAADTKSTAALKLVRHLRWPWPLLSALLIVPRPVRDAVYDFIARRRQRWFGRPDACHRPDPQLRQRILEP